MARNYYEILGVARNASQKEIESAYKQKAREYHPDMHVDNPLAHLAEAQMKEVNEAYTVLRDPMKRREYDLRLGGVRTPPPPDPDDYFGQYESQQRSYPGADAWGRQDRGESGRLNELRDQAVDLFNTRQYAHCVDVLSEYLRLSPNDAGAHNLMGLARMEMREYQASIYAFANAIRLDPRNAAYFFNSGVANFLNGNFRQAIPHLDKAVNLDSNNPQYLIGLATALHRTGNHMRARSMFQRAKAINPNDPNVRQYEARQAMRSNMRNSYYNMPCGCYCCPSLLDLACCALCCDCCTPGCGCFTLGL